jgi:hypothetical protein
MASTGARDSARNPLRSVANGCAHAKVTQNERNIFYPIASTFRALTLILAGISIHGIAVGSLTHHTSYYYAVHAASLLYLHPCAVRSLHATFICFPGIVSSTD